VSYMNLTGRVLSTAALSYTVEYSVNDPNSEVQWGLIFGPASVPTSTLMLYPGQTITWTWGAIDNQGREAPPGDYRVVLMGTGSDAQSASAGGGITPGTPVHTRINYYYLGSQRVAMRRGTVGEAGAVFYLHGDHLGSVSDTTTSIGGLYAKQRFAPYGKVRYSFGMFSMPTSYNFTGQRLDTTGLLYFGARYYHPYLNRWIQPDTIVPDPGNPQSLNRFAYSYNNPVKYRDPSGHRACEGDPQDCQPPPANNGYANSYGIFFYPPDWTAAQIAVILQAAQLVENALKRGDFISAHRYGEGCSLCGYSSGGKAFQAVFGSVTMQRVDEDICCMKTDRFQNTIIVWNDAFKYNLLFNTIHEFGHLFAHHANNQQPYDELINTPTKVDGVLVFGGHTRTDYGYKPGPGGSQFPYQQHPCCIPGYDPAWGGEDFADMFLNWSLNSFANNSYGTARYNWIDVNMPRWISLAVSGTP